MKKIIALLLCVTLVLPLGGCRIQSVLRNFETGESLFEKAVSSLIAALDEKDEEAIYNLLSLSVRDDYDNLQDKISLLVNACDGPIERVGDISCCYTSESVEDGEVEKEIDNVFPIYANGEYYWIYLKLMYENSYKRREGITKLTFYTASDYYYYYHCDDTVITDEPITICNSSNTDGVVSIENYPQRIIDNRTIKLEDVKDQLEKTKSLGSFQKRFGSAPVADSDDLSCHYLLPDENGEKRYLKFVYDKGEIIAANVLDEFYFLEALLEEE